LSSDFLSFAAGVSPANSLDVQPARLPLQLVKILPAMSEHGHAVADRIDHIG